MVPQHIRNYYETRYRPEKVREFYGYVAETQDLSKKAGWELNLNFTQRYCGFWVKRETDEREIWIYGVHLDYNPLRFFVKITQEESGKLRNQYGCDPVYYHTHVGQAFYRIPGDVEQLLRVLEFAYNKHRGI